MGPVACFSLCLFSCLIFSPSLAAPALSAKAQGPFCPTGWSFIQGTCYGYFSQKKTWFEAEAECQNHCGAHLASILSFTDNNVLANYSSENSKSSSIWIGLHYLEENQSWSWTDESPFCFSSWDNRQPEGPSKNEHCVILPYYTGFQKWHDYPCNSTFSFVCQHKP